MTTVLCFCRVADYDVFRAGHARAVEAVPEMLSYRLWRGQDDRDLIVIEETFASREVAQAVWTSPEGQQGMIDDGIDMSSVRIEYVDEVASGTR